MINGHGDDIHAYTDIRLNCSSNIYSHFCHDGLYAHLAEVLPSVANYPEPSPERLEAALAADLRLSPSEVIATAGATEAIYLVAQVFRRSTSYILQPTFSEYADACRTHEHRVKAIYSLKDIPASDGPSGVGPLLWLCNPNNPTGTVVPESEMRHFIEIHPHTLFVIDASYAPFTQHPLISQKEAAALPNIIMLHSMTKEFAVPGLRLGYITANQTLSELLRRQRMPWTVGSISQAAGIYLLQHKADYVLPLADLLHERERVAAELSKTGVIEPWPSDTHILLCRLRIGRASALKEWLATERGILIRDASNFEGLDASFFRIAVQTPEENNALIAAIQEWIR